MVRISIVSSCFKECSHRESASSAEQLLSHSRVDFSTKISGICLRDEFFLTKTTRIRFFSTFVNALQARKRCRNCFSPNISKRVRSFRSCENLFTAGPARTAVEEEETRHNRGPGKVLWNTGHQSLLEICFEKMNSKLPQYS